MSTFLKSLQSLSGTRKDEAGAANAWAGTTGLEVLGALNAKAGTKGLGLNAVVQALGGVGEAYKALNAIADAAPPGGMSFWGKADSLALANGAAVSTWTDSSLKGWNVTQPTGANRPTLAENAINGHNAISFTAASNHYLTRTAAMPGFLNAAKGYTVVAACAVNTTAASQVLHFVSGGLDTTTTRARASFSATNRYPNPQARNTDADGSPITATGTAGSNATAGQWQVTTQNVDWETGTISAWKNGALVLGPSAVLTPGSASPTDVQGMRIGCQSTGSGLWLDGLLAEILVYPRTLTAAERSRVNAYLGAKYGIAVS